ncbi:MAG: permease [Roseiflexus sp.]
MKEVGRQRWAQTWKPMTAILAVFLAVYYLPIGWPRFDNALVESLELTKWYAQEHVILCLLPAFYIAGAIAAFVSQGSVMRYLGAGANKVLSYGVASVSGTILAVCSCTVLPLFAGIHRMGAGLGPAVAFLYSGPAINVLAIVMTAAVLGPSLGVARAVGAIVFSIVIGLIMATIYRGEERAKVKAQAMLPVPEVTRPLWQNAVYFGALVGILVFANWGRPQEISGLWGAIYTAKWSITAGFELLLAFALWRWFGVPWWKVTVVTIITAGAALFFTEAPQVPFIVGLIGITVLTTTSQGEMGEWFDQSWGFAKQILPLLLIGVLISGFLLGRPGHEGLIPSAWVAATVGGNSLLSNFVAAFLGAFMYFATLTEVPIVQGLVGAGMGQGPALALLLAGPALSLPNMLVIRSVVGTQKTIVFVMLVIVFATLTGWAYGTWIAG